MGLDEPEARHREFPHCLGHAAQSFHTRSSTPDLANTAPIDSESETPDVLYQQTVQILLEAAGTNGNRSQNGSELFLVSSDSSQRHFVLNEKIFSHKNPGVTKIATRGVV